MVFWSTDTHLRRPIYQTWPVHSNLSIFRDQSQKMWYTKLQTNSNWFKPSLFLSLSRVSLFFPSLLFFRIAISTVIIKLRLCVTQSNQFFFYKIYRYGIVCVHACVHACVGAYVWGRCSFSFALIFVCILLFRHQDAPILSMACQ